MRAGAGLTGARRRGFSGARMMAMSTVGTRLAHHHATPATFAALAPGRTRLPPNPPRTRDAHHVAAPFPLVIAPDARRTPPKLCIALCVLPHPLVRFLIPLANLHPRQSAGDYQALISSPSLLSQLRFEFVGAATRPSASLSAFAPRAPRAGMAVGSRRRWWAPNPTQHPASRA